MSDASFQLPRLPDRPVEGHKGTFGTVIVIGGSKTMIGAPALAATAAFRTGCGLVKLLTDPAALPHCLTIEPSATGLDIAFEPEAITAAIAGMRERVVLAIGPGLGTSDRARRIVAALLTAGRPIVLDADGLNCLALLGDSVKRIDAPAVLTPHPGEFKRLADASGIEHDATHHAVRPRAAAALAERYGCTVVLKGSNTIVSEGHRVYRNDTGNVALATAGSGDVLTGAIAGLMAQGMTPMDAAALGVHLHGLAADMWAELHGRAGLVARDLAALLPDAMLQYESTEPA
jgi:NAD(P)H-hydrate epimerase